MKLKWLLTLAILLGSSNLIAADMEPDKSDGCGLGWNIYDSKTILGTSIRGTTNQLIPSQTSGMTSGTSNCVKHDIVLKDKEPLYFTEANYESLVVEIAEGQGEYLNQYAQILGCEASKFSKATQKNFEQLIPANSTDAVQFYMNIKTTIKNENLNCAV
jgi:hypothetical protein